MSVGGDGTVNEIINGFIENHLLTPLAILPGGTVNDFANHLHLPHNTDDFIQMIQDFQTMKVDIGKVNEQYLLMLLLVACLVTSVFKYLKMIKKDLVL